MEQAVGEPDVMMRPRRDADLTKSLEPASSSVFAELAESVGGLPRVLPRDSDAETSTAALVKPSTAEMPAERPDRYQLFGDLRRNARRRRVLLRNRPAKRLTG